VRATICCVCLLAYQGNTYSDEFHYNSLLVGGKAIGLGGAYMAISDDLSAMYYNPAGLSFNKVKYSASFNTLAWDNTDVYAIFGNGESFTRKSFTVVPGFFGFSRKDAQFSYGGFFSVTDFSKERTATDVLYSAPGRFSEAQQDIIEFNNVDLDNSAYRLGFSVAYDFGNNSSLGASLNLDYKELVSVQGSGSTSTEFFNGIPVFSGFNASVRFSDINVIVQPALGFLKNWDTSSFGIKFSRDIVVSRDYDVTSTLFLNSPIPLPPTVLTSARINSSADEAQEYPYQIHAGYAFQYGKVLISTDISYFTRVKATPYYIDGVKPITRNLRSVTNFALAMQYDFSAQNTFRLGLFTDNSNAIIDPAINFDRVEDIDMLGVSIGFDTTFYSSPISLGLYYKFGDGQVRIADRRIAETLIGLPLFPDEDQSDIFEAKKNSLVAYFAIDF
jgi:hypothetical protein